MANLMNKIVILSIWAPLLAAYARSSAGQAPPRLAKHDVQLPAAVASIAIGGNGRYLALHFPELRRLGVFDLAREEIAFVVRLLEDNVLFAANRDSLIVITRESGLMQRWNLETGKREQETAFPIDDVLKAVAMGAASNGPLMVFHAHGLARQAKAHYSLIDPETLEVTRIQKPLRDGQTVHIRASGDGRLFGLWRAGVSPTGMVSLWIKREEITTHYLHESVGHVVPGAGGDLLFTAKGIFTADLQSAPHEGVDERSFCVPAVTGPMFVVMNLQQLEVRAGGQTVATVPATSLRRDPMSERWLLSDMTVDKRIVLAPAVNRLALLSITKPDVIEVYRFAAETLTKSAGAAVLRVASEPPVETQKGERLEYRVETTAGDSDVEFELIVGPDGMQVSPNGVVTWQVPADYDRITARVILVVKDASSGRQVRHGFVVRVRSQ